MPDFGIYFYAEFELMLLNSKEIDNTWTAPRYLKPGEY
jgi:hypothetical protein